MKCTRFPPFFPLQIMTIYTIADVVDTGDKYVIIDVADTGQKKAGCTENLRKIHK
jgi:hypothetical protein